MSQQIAMAIQLLRDTEQRSRRYGAPLPRGNEHQAEIWTGLGLQIDQTLAVVELDSVREVLVCPKLTYVPNTKNWVKGVANLRGVLLPVFDLGLYLNGQEIPLGGASRVIVIRENDIMAGLLVNEVLGQRHFEVTQRVASRDAGSHPLLAFSQTAFRHDGRVWPVFDVGKLTQTASFIQVMA